MLLDNNEEEIINTAIENTRQYLIFEKATKENAYKAFIKYADAGSLKEIRSDKPPIENSSRVIQPRGEI
jgi:hypothetical protein